MIRKRSDSVTVPILEEYRFHTTSSSELDLYEQVKRVLEIIGSNIKSVKFDIYQWDYSILLEPILSNEEKYGISGVPVSLIEEAATDQESYDLLISAMESDIEKNKADIEYLISEGKDINAADKFGCTVFCKVLENHRSDIAYFLIDKGLNLRIRNKEGHTPLHLAAKFNNTDVIEYLLYKGADIEAKDYKGETPLHMACRNGCVKAMVLLLEKGANLAAKNYMGDTLLHIATESPSLDALRYLLECNFEIDVQNNIGYTPLHCAITKANKAAVQLLVINGASVDARTYEENLTPLHIISKAPYFIINSIPIVEFLIKQGAKIDAQDSAGNTPLHLAIKNYKYDIAQLLVNAGANVNLQNQEGNTLLHDSIAGGNTLLIKSLLPKSDLKIRNKKEETPFALAIKIGYQDIVELIQKESEKRESLTTME